MEYFPEMLLHEPNTALVLSFSEYKIHAICSCGVKEFDNRGPLYTKPKAHAEEEEMAEDEWRKPKWPRNIVEDNPVLGQPRS